MANETKKERSEGSIIWSGFDSWGHLWRFLIGLVVLGLTVVGALFLAAKFSGLLNIEAISLQGNTVTFANRDQLVLLPANAVWIETEVKVPAGEAVRVTSTGRVHLAIHHVVRAANSDKRVRFPWSGPKGQPVVANEEQVGAVGSDQFKICPEQPYGKLLAYVGSSTPTKYAPQPDGIQAVGKDGVIRNTSNLERPVWLVVNDVVLSPDSEQAFLRNNDGEALLERYRAELLNGGKAAPTKEDALKLARDNWEAIKKDQYWEIWFDDNVGNLLVIFEQLGKDKSKDELKNCE